MQGQGQQPGPHIQLGWPLEGLWSVWRKNRLGAKRAQAPD